MLTICIGSQPSWAQLFLVLKHWRAQHHTASGEPLRSLLCFSEVPSAHLRGKRGCRRWGREKCTSVLSCDWKPSWRKRGKGATWERPACWLCPYSFLVYWGNTICCHHLLSIIYNCVSVLLLIFLVLPLPHFLLWNQAYCRFWLNVLVREICLDWKKC